MTDRFEIVAEPEFIESVRAAARASGGMSMSAYARLAMLEKMARDGHDKPGAVAKPAHRPKKGKGKP